MMEFYAIEVFVDLLRRYGNTSPMDEFARIRLTLNANGRRL